MRQMLCGSFSSAAQAERDPENYVDIRLEVVPIWTEREDGPWLYVEQAAAVALERPYRQRVYQLEGGPHQGFRSTVYELPGDPLAFAGAQNDEVPLAELGPEALSLLEGCTVYLALQEDRTVLG
ncbi:MAG: chromophore lyase CpcT/CpeT, partial [Planctomycetota bacterium]